jgi:hypothetical protein
MIRSPVTRNFLPGITLNTDPLITCCEMSATHSPLATGSIMMMALPDKIAGGLVLFFQLEAWLQSPLPVNV